MTLDTNLTHITDADDLQRLIKESENLMVCCGRMGPMCIPVYEDMEELENSGDYDDVIFRDILFDIPAAAFIREHPRCARFMGIPFTVYFKNGEMVEATTSIQSKEQIQEILDREFK